MTQEADRVLAVDVGGTHVKLLLQGETQRRRFCSGGDMTAREMVEGVKKSAQGWTFGRVSIGYPGPVLHGRPLTEPPNLGCGWVGFDFAAAFGKPVRLINDAAMQALGAYKGGRMLFLGLGTGLGTALVFRGIVEPMELAHLPYKKATFEDYVGLRGLKRLGKKKWRRNVEKVVAKLNAAFEPDEIVIGGGNARKLKKLPPKCRLGSNADAMSGAFRLWDDVTVARGE
jgi:polyphosphate glucokinase